MLCVKTVEGEYLVTQSSYDSGNHKGFNVHLSNEGGYGVVTLDKMLTKSQIKSIELTIASMVMGYIRK